MLPPTELEGVQFHAAFEAQTCLYDRALGFFAMHDASGETSNKTLLGFGAPLSPEGGFDSRTFIKPLVNLHDLDPEDRTVDINGKGVGPRLYNTPQAAHGLTDLPEVFGAYLFTVQKDKLRDTRQTEGSAPTRIGRHALRIAKSIGNSSHLEHIVERVHESYGDADAVLFSQPPRAALRQRVERRVHNPADIPAEFIIVRNVLVTLRRIGTVHRVR